MLSSTWTMSTRGSQQVEIAEVNDIGRSLPCLVAVRITHTTKRWSNEATTIDYIKNIIITYK